MKQVNNFCSNSTHNWSSIDKYIWIHLRARAQCSLFAITINHHKWRVENFFTLNARDGVFFWSFLLCVQFDFIGANFSIGIILYTATFIFGFYLISTWLLYLKLIFNKISIKIRIEYFCFVVLYGLTIYRHE